MNYLKCRGVLRRAALFVGLGTLGMCVAGVAPPFGDAVAGGRCRPAKTAPAKAKPGKVKRKRVTPGTQPVAGKGHGNKRHNDKRRVARVATKKGGLTGKLNLNTATSLELQILPGVGPRRARRIIAWRTRRAFKHIWDLKRVRGFGRKTLRRLSRYLTTKGKNTLQRAKE